MDTTINVAVELAVRQTQYGIATSLQVCVLAGIAAALLWGTVPILPIALNNEHRRGEGKVTKELVADYILKFIGYTRALKGIHKYSFNAGRASGLQGDIANEGMFHCGLRVSKFPLADTLTKGGAGTFVVLPVDFCPFTTGSAFDVQLAHKSGKCPCVTESASLCDGLHGITALKPPFYAFLERLTKCVLCLSRKVTAAVFVSAFGRTGFLMVGARLVSPVFAADNAHKENGRLSTRATTERPSLKVGGVNVKRFSATGASDCFHTTNYTSVLRQNGTRAFAAVIE